MNYLTNYYKNLSEQLQEKVNHLQQLIESKRKTEDVLVTGYEVTGRGPTEPSKMKISGVLTKGKGAKRGREVVVDAGDAIGGLRLLGTGLRPGTGLDPVEAFVAGVPASRENVIGTSKTPTITVSKRDLNPDLYDGADRDLKADTNEVLRGKTEEQMRASLPTPEKAAELRRLYDLWYGK